MNSKAKKWFVGVMFGVIALFILGRMMAFADVNPTQLTLSNPISCGDFNCVATDIINFIFDLAIPLTAIMALVGGFQMITAAGDPEKFSKGRKTLLYAAIGFAVVLLSSGVVAFIKSLLGTS